MGLLLYRMRCRTRGRAETGGRRLTSEAPLRYLWEACAPLVELWDMERCKEVRK